MSSFTLTPPVSDLSRRGLRAARRVAQLPCSVIARHLFRVATALLVTALAACAAKPQRLQVEASAAPVINRDAVGGPLSVVVRLYQLKDRTAFDLLTFERLTRARDDRELLGEQLLARHEFVVVPGGSYSASEPLAAETRYVGLAGFFREPDRQHWRFIIDARAARENGLRFRLEDCHLKVLAPEPLAMPGQPSDHRPWCRDADGAGNTRS